MHVDQGACGGHQYCVPRTGLNFVNGSGSNVVQQCHRKSYTANAQGQKRTPAQRTGQSDAGVAAWVGGGIDTAVPGRTESRFNPNSEPVVQVGGMAAVKSCSRAECAGHYVANGFINGYPVTFLVDTGATDVALSEAWPTTCDCNAVAAR